MYAADVRVPKILCSVIKTHQKQQRAIEKIAAANRGTNGYSMIVNTTPMLQQFIHFCCNQQQQVRELLNIHS